MGNETERKRDERDIMRLFVLLLLVLGANIISHNFIRMKYFIKRFNFDIKFLWFQMDRDEKAPREGEEVNNEMFSH